jgi:hypothetical protein
LRTSRLIKAQSTKRFHDKNEKPRSHGDDRG